MQRLQTAAILCRPDHLNHTIFDKEHTKDRAVQTLYQSPDELLELYKYLNFDFEQQAGLQASVPFKAGK